MKIKKSCFLIVFLLTISMFKSFGQDPIYSQYYANPLYLNPALAGSTLSPRIIANYRNQWPSLKANFVTYNFSYEQYVGKINSTFALLANMDRTAAGAYSTASISFIYTYNLQASHDWFVNMSVQGGVYENTIRWNALIFEDAIHPVHGLSYYHTSETPPDKPTVWLPDFSFGTVVGYKDFFYGGIAIHHLAEPHDGLFNKEDSRLYRKYTGHVGCNFKLNNGKTVWGKRKPTTISPAILYQQQLNFKVLSAGVYFNYYPLVAGAWYRCNIENPDAVILMLGLQYNNFQIGYSYDITVSKLANVTGGAHEVSLSYKFENWGNNKSRTKRHAIPCPHF